MRAERPGDPLPVPGSAAGGGQRDLQAQPAVRRLLPPDAGSFFRAERVDLAGRAVEFQPGVAVLIVLAGAGQPGCGGASVLPAAMSPAATPSASVPLAAGTTLFVPYDAGPTRIGGELSVLRCLPPAPGQEPGQEGA